MAILTCPTCGKPFDSERTAAIPFCSRRCQQIDLGRWLNEEHGMPIEREDGMEELPDPPESSFN